VHRVVGEVRGDQVGVAGVERLVVGADVVEVGDDGILTGGCRFGPHPFVVRVKRREAPQIKEETMKYLLALISEEGGMEDASPEEMKAVMDRWSAYGKEAVENGAFLAGEALQPSETVSTVRIEDGKPTVTDGPFAESKEQLGGFYLLECKDLDEALEYAKKIPFENGFVEVRPVMDFSEQGYEDPTEAAKATTS
jgi:hypothetical protein